MASAHLEAEEKLNKTYETTSGLL